MLSIIYQLTLTVNEILDKLENQERYHSAKLLLEICASKFILLTPTQQEIYLFIEKKIYLPHPLGRHAQVMNKIANVFH